LIENEKKDYSYDKKYSLIKFNNYKHNIILQLKIIKLIIITKYNLRWIEFDWVLVGYKSVTQSSYNWIEPLGDIAKRTSLHINVALVYYFFLSDVCSSTHQWRCCFNSSFLSSNSKPEASYIWVGNFAFNILFEKAIVAPIDLQRKKPRMINY